MYENEDERRRTKEERKKITQASLCQIVTLCQGVAVAQRGVV